MHVWVLTLCLGLSWVAAGWAEEPAPAIHGGGTKNFMPMFTGRQAIGNSQIFQTGGDPLGIGASFPLIGIGTTNPGGTLHLNSGGTADHDFFIIGDPNAKAFMIRDNFGIDMQTSGVPLVINCCNSGDVLMFVDGDNKLGIGTADPTNILTVKQGSVTDPIADAWTTYSSRRWKTNIRPLDGALDKVQRLRGVYFDWKGTGKHDLGLVAEEVASVLPEVVAYEENGQDAKSVDYGRLTALLVEAVKEQQSQISELKSRLARSEARP